MFIRKENIKDYEEVYNLVKNAFETSEHKDGNEQDLVNALRQSECFVPQLSLVAVEDGKIIGHIMFTEAHVGNDKVLALAPLSVLPEYQHKHVGTSLINEGHSIARHLNYNYSVVLGDVSFYSAFGYVLSEKLGVFAPKGIPKENLMALKLNQDSAPICGIIEYAREFGL